MFSHTIKGQPYNTPLLAKFVRPSDEMVSETVESLSNHPSGFPRLVDYELLTDDTTGKRTVGFGWFAGGIPQTIHPYTFFSLPNSSVAGALESLSAAAHSHLEIGVASPFLVNTFPVVTLTLILILP